MTSDPSSFPQRLTKVDEITRGDHTFLRDDDACFFLGEYTARKGFSHSATNNLIINFKKPLDRKGKPEWRFKAAKIAEAAKAMHSALKGYDLRSTTFVPVPPSKHRDDPLYDDRMMAMMGQLSGLFLASNGYSLDIKELVSQRRSTAAAHDGDARPRPEDLVGIYDVDLGLLPNASGSIVICDDVLTTGSHYRAMCDVLRRHLPQATFAGLFLARRAPEANDFALWFGEE